MTKYVGNVLVSPTSEDAILEFEDIHFIGSKNSNQTCLICFKGHFTTFRRCRFSGISVLVSGNAPMSPIQRSTASLQAQLVNESLGTPNVVFENCLMDSGVVGVSTGFDGTVTLLNCVIRDCKEGILTSAGSRVVVKHCLVEDCETGVAIGAKTISFDMCNCSVLAGECGIMASAGGPVTITGCRVENCTSVGVLLHGRNKHVNRTTISHCHIARCETCMCLDDGEFATTVDYTCLHKSKYGICISPAAIGSVKLNQCRLEENESINIINTASLRTC